MTSSSIYEEKPWLKSYPPGVRGEVEIPDISVNEAFDTATMKHRDRTALNFYGKKIRFNELRDKVDRLAAALFDLGIKKGDRVAVLLLNSPEHVIAFYALLKVGAVITPISPVYVSSEIRHQLEDSGAKSVICQDILYDALEKTEWKFKHVILTNISESLTPLKKMMGRSILRSVYQKGSVPSKGITLQEGFYRLQDLIHHYSPEPPRLEINPKEDLAILPYTGGTTGAPKGVMITHYNIIAAVTQIHGFFNFLEEGKEALVAYMPYYHAAGQVTALLDGVLFGATQYILTTPEPDYILNILATRNVTSFLGAPSIFEMLKDYKKTDRVNWRKLKYVMSGADSLNEATAKGWRARTGVGLTDAYGMTETTAVAISTPVGRERIGSIGIPMPGTGAAILDPFEDQLLPQGEIGELVISGPQVSLGYWKNPGATRDCEAVINQIRWWRTGDLAKMDEDGYFYIYDRKRDLIKYKGLRVYAREVEEVLSNHPQIKEVGVVGVKDIKVGEVVKAFVVLETDAGGQVSEQDVIEYCKDKLASYKIPRIVEFVGEIPKTDVGKVSRRELKEWES